MYNRIKFFIGALFLFISILLLFTVNWALNTFGMLSVDEIIYHFSSTMTGTNKILIYDFINNCLFPTVLISMFVIAVIFYNPFNFEIKGKIEVHEKKVFQIYPFIHIRKYFMYINIVFLLLTLYNSSSRVGITEYIAMQYTPSDFIKANYVDAKDATIIFPGKKRNLIYIYMESLETTYLSNSLGGYQNKNLMPNLVDLTSGETNFSNSDLLGGAVSNTGSTWTVAGIVSETSGMPIKADANSYGSNKEYLPGIYTLGDILKEEGYNQMFMMGSDAKFGGREYYLKLHGDYQIYDYYTAIENKKIPNTYYEWWGFEDSKLYSYAKEEILKLASKDEPFNFTMLTADTHFPDGYLSESCKHQNKFEDNLSNVIACADEMLYDFISWIKKQDFYENTTIIISGDHLSMDVNFFKDLTDYERTIYNLFINSAVTTDNTKNRTFTTMDMFPSTLASLGAIVDGDRLGLGTNLFSDKKTLAEQYGIEYLNKELAKKSDFYSENILQ